MGLKDKCLFLPHVIWFTSRIREEKNLQLIYELFFKSMVAFSSSSSSPQLIWRFYYISLWWARVPVSLRCKDGVYGFFYLREVGSFCTLSWPKLICSQNLGKKPWCVVKFCQLKIHCPSSFVRAGGVWDMLNKIYCKSSELTFTCNWRNLT